MKTQHTLKMPRKLKKWYKANLLRYLFAQASMSWADYNKMDKLYRAKGKV